VYASDLDKSRVQVGKDWFVNPKKLSKEIWQMKNEKVILNYKV
jgi:hypothetical protein